jgi:hypothetical protein
MSRTQLEKILKGRAFEAVVAIATLLPLVLAAIYLYVYGPQGIFIIIAVFLFLAIPVNVIIRRRVGREIDQICAAANLANSPQRIEPLAPLDMARILAEQMSSEQLAKALAIFSALFTAMILTALSSSVQLPALETIGVTRFVRLAGGFFGAVAIALVLFQLVAKWRKQK